MRPDYSLTPIRMTMQAGCVRALRAGRQGGGGGLPADRDGDGGEMDLGPNLRASWKRQVIKYVKTTNRPLFGDGGEMDLGPNLRAS